MIKLTKNGFVFHSEKISENLDYRTLACSPLWDHRRHSVLISLSSSQRKIDLGYPFHFLHRGRTLIPTLQYQAHNHIPPLSASQMV